MCIDGFKTFSHSFRRVAHCQLAANSRNDRTENCLSLSQAYVKESEERHAQHRHCDPKRGQDAVANAKVGLRLRRKVPWQNGKIQQVSHHNEQLNRCTCFPTNLKHIQILPRNEKSIPPRELTYPTWGKGKSSSNVPWWL